MKNSSEIENKLEFSNIRKDKHKGIKELERDIRENNYVKKAFLNIKNSEEAIKVARNLGYEINEKDLENSVELNEDLLEAVAGGKIRYKQRSLKTNVNVPGNDAEVKFNLTWDAAKEGKR